MVAQWGNHMTAELFIEFVGSLGVLCYVGSYALLQLGVIRGNGYLYALMNLGGALFVAISMLNNWNTWSALVSLAFTIFSLIGIYRIYMASRNLRFNDEEHALIAARLITMQRSDARRLLNKGNWRDGNDGDVLTEQGRAVTRLFYIGAGGADVVVGKQRIAQIGAGEFIGELACMTQGNASATVVLNQSSRLFEVSSEALNSLVRGKPDLRAQLEFSFAGNIQSKLLATNALLEQALRSNTGAAAKSTPMGHLARHL